MYPTAASTVLFKNTAFIVFLSYFMFYYFGRLILIWLFMFRTIFLHSFLRKREVGKILDAVVIPSERRLTHWSAHFINQL